MTTPAHSPQLQQLRDLIDELGAASSQNRSERKTLIEAIGPIVKALREQAGWSVHQLAKRADCNMSAIHRLEQGVKLPGKPLLEALVWAFGEGRSQR